ncbi:MAG: hypothetical protein K2F85_05595 [Helicobacter sp.]|nr:hypothetical protein [Helicobacter sp.]
MKKIFVIFTLLGAMFAESQNGFLSEVGAGIGYYRYDEPQVMNTDDLLLNLNAKLGYRHHFIKTEGIGNVFVAFGRYNGAILELGENGEGQERKLRSISASQIFDGQAKIGFDMLFFSDSMDLFVQSGIGYWQLFYFSTSYDRKQGYLYVPIELEGEIRSTPSFAWTYLLGYKHLIEGRHTTTISSLGIADVDLFARQDKGFGLKASFGWKQQNKDSTNFTRFIVDYWKIDESTRSEPTTTHLGRRVQFVEPRNFTVSVYLQYGWNF